MTSFALWKNYVVIGIRTGDVAFLRRESLGSKNGSFAGGLPSRPLQVEYLSGRLEGQIHEDSLRAVRFYHEGYQKNVELVVASSYYYLHVVGYELSPINISMLDDTQRLRAICRQSALEDPVYHLGLIDHDGGAQRASTSLQRGVTGRRVLQLLVTSHVMQVSKGSGSVKIWAIELQARQLGAPDTLNIVLLRQLRDPALEQAQESSMVEYGVVQSLSRDCFLTQNFRTGLVVWRLLLGDSGTLLGNL